MTSWVRFNWNGSVHHGRLDGETIEVCSNDLFETALPTGDMLGISEVELLAPFKPNSIIGLWNNFHERAEAEGQTIPSTPLYFMKPVTSVIDPGDLESLERVSPGMASELERAKSRLELELTAN